MKKWIVLCLFAAATSSIAAATEAPARRDSTVRAAKVCCSEALRTAKRDRHSPALSLLQASLAPHGAATIAAAGTVGRAKARPAARTAAPALAYAARP